MNNMHLPTLGSMLLSGGVSLTKQSSITNPILPGFHPDPSCIYVPDWNNTFFCSASTFNWFPGLPVYASRDLQHWKLVSNALGKPEQLPYMAYNNRGQSGIYAPTLRYRDGTFTIITTLANQALPRENLTRWDNIIFNTKDPYGEWDDPIHVSAQFVDCYSTDILVVLRPWHRSFAILGRRRGGLGLKHVQLIWCCTCSCQPHDWGGNTTL